MKLNLVAGETMISCKSLNLIDSSADLIEVAMMDGKPDLVAFFRFSETRLGKDSILLKINIHCIFCGSCFKFGNS